MNAKPALEVMDDFRISHLSNNAQSQVIKYFTIDESVYRHLLLWEGYAEGIIRFGDPKKNEKVIEFIPE